MRSDERIALAILAAALVLPWFAGGSGLGSILGWSEGASPDGSVGATTQRAETEGANGSRRAAARGMGGSEGDWDASAFVVGSGDIADWMWANGDVPNLESVLAELAGRSSAEAGRSVVGAGDGAAGAAPVRAVPVDFSYSNRDPAFRQRPRADFDPRDLAVLDEIIRLNGLDEASSEFDYDDGDGELEPTELGDQRWCNGRLRELRLGPDFFSSFGYQVGTLPPSIADLDGLMVLEANAVGLRAIPEEVSTLSGLRRLSVYNNQIPNLPPGIGELPALEEVQATGNVIRTVPAELERSQSLRRLFVDTNELVAMPDMLVRQQQAMARGQLEIPSRGLGPLNSSCLPSS